MNVILLTAALLAAPPAPSQMQEFDARLTHIEEALGRLARAVEVLALQKNPGGPGLEINQFHSHDVELSKRGDVMLIKHNGWPTWTHAIYSPPTPHVPVNLLWANGKPVIQGAIFLGESEMEAAGKAMEEKMQQQGPEIFRGGQRGR